MRTKPSVLSLVLLGLLVNSTVTFAGQSGNWTAVEAIAVGEKVRVQLKDGKKHDGILRSVTPSALTLQRSGSASDYNRDSIAKVHRYVRRSLGKSIAKSTAIGAGIGFGAGAGVALVAGNYEDLDTSELVAFLGGIGAAIGAGIGALAGSVGKREKRELVYEAR